MSYDLTIYHRDVREAAERGVELYGAPHRAFTPAQRDAFAERLLANGYVLEHASADHREYVKHVADCPVQVSIYDSEIGVGIPYWENVEQALAVAIDELSRLVDDEMALFDPQEGRWIDAPP